MKEHELPLAADPVTCHRVFKSRAVAQTIASIAAALRQLVRKEQGQRFFNDHLRIAMTDLADQAFTLVITADIDGFQMTSMLLVPLERLDAVAQRELTKKGLSSTDGLGLAFMEAISEASAIYWSRLHALMEHPDGSASIRQ